MLSQSAQIKRRGFVMEILTEITVKSKGFILLNASNYYPLLSRVANGVSTNEEDDTKKKS